MIPAINDYGAVAFKGEIGFFGGPVGIWAEEKGCQLRLVVKQDDEIEVGDGDSRMVGSLQFRTRAYNDSMQVAFIAVFKDNSRGVLVATLNPTDPLDLLNDLNDQIEALQSNGAKKPLRGKIQVALSKLSDGNPANDSAAASVMSDFVSIVEAKAGKSIPQDDADALVSEAETIICLISAG
jgi:hypothetical protein